MKTPRIPIALQQAVMVCLREKLVMACEFFQQQFPEPLVIYQQRGTLAGSAWLSDNQIRLNPVLLLENQQVFIGQVVPHELAHLLVWQRFGRVAPHGKEWKWMMETVLKVPAHRTHQFSLQPLRRRLFMYHCDCQSYQLTLHRHNKIQCGTEYRCVHCGGRLRPVADTDRLD